MDSVDAVLSGSYRAAIGALYWCRKCEYSQLSVTPLNLSRQRTQNAHKT